jgi:hypothetical protein
MNAVNIQNSLRVKVLIPVEARSIFFANAHTPELGPNKSPIQWIPGRLSPGVKQPERAIKNQTHISPRLRMHEPKPTLPSLCHGMTFIYLSTMTTLPCTVYRNFKFFLVHSALYPLLITQRKVKFIMLSLCFINRNQKYNCIYSE